VYVSPTSGDDITALLLAPVGGCKISYKTMQVEQTATLLHALKCEHHTAYMYKHINTVYSGFSKVSRFKISSMCKQNKISELFMAIQKLQTYL